MYIEESNGNKYLTLVLTDESKGILKTYEELWSKIRDLTRSISNHLHSTKLNNSINYIGKCMIIKFNSNDDLPLNKTH